MVLPSNARFQWAKCWKKQLTVWRASCTKGNSTFKGCTLCVLLAHYGEKKCFWEVEHCLQFFSLIFVDFFKTTKGLHCQNVQMVTLRFFAKTAELRSAIYAIILDICVIIRKKPNIRSSLMIFNISHYNHIISWNYVHS